MATEEKKVSQSFAQEDDDLRSALLFLDENSPSYELTKLSIQRMKTSNPEAYDKMVNMN